MDPPHVAGRRFVARSLRVSAEVWCRLLKNLGKLFDFVADQHQQIDSYSLKAFKSAHRFRIRRAARELMARAQQQAAEGGKLQRAAAVQGTG